MNTTSIRCFAMAAAAMFAINAYAKLPPLTDEAKAKADETKNKAAWTDKVAAYQLCEAQNRIAARYLQEKHKPKPTVDVPACQNPGSYVPLQANTAAVGVADSKPIPQVGAKK
ncbi:MAG TPA: hypothetical protein VHL60_03900 [Oxalicibacterium sp.]|nr:hypothetical protein [Oxalicibacterium sp.]